MQTAPLYIIVIKDYFSRQELRRRQHLNIDNALKMAKAFVDELLPPRMNGRNQLKELHYYNLEKNHSTLVEGKKVEIVTDFVYL